jgi:hypothetical protein
MRTAKTVMTWTMREALMATPPKRMERSLKKADTIGNMGLAIRLTTKESSEKGSESLATN